jgi:two-component system, chemotaxis family, chemotaxis protein CheY
MMAGRSHQGESGKKLTLDRLRAGDKLFDEVRGNTGGQLFKAGDVIAEDDITTMKNFGVEHVWVVFTDDMNSRARTLASQSGPGLAAGAAPGRGILIVDDVALIRKQMRGIFESLGHNVVGEAEDGDEAVHLSRLLAPDLITMDIIMKRMNGVTAVKAIKKERPEVKVIMVTSVVHPELIKESVKAGASGFIKKPVDKAQIEKAIQKAFS